MAKAETTARTTRRHARPRIRVVRSHWKLFTAAAIGVLVGLACSTLTPFRLVTDLILAWDATALIFIGLVLLRIRGASIEHIRAHAALEDQGRAVILVLVIVAVSASLGGVAVELGLARGMKGWNLAGHVLLTGITVAASWFMMQLVYALRYAHEYYDPDEKDGIGDAEGLAFPGGEAPDYWDFLHFSAIIGVACQTADIAITDKGMRRLCTLHSLVAFAFNTVIVALTINLLAGLFG
jgi:uncharacterized membrane protein